MKTNILIILCLASTMFTGCARIIYSSDAYSRAHAHKTIAIAPPTVTIQSRKQTTPEILKEQQKAASEIYQRTMYNWINTRKSQNMMFVDIMSVETTNEKLRKDGYFDLEPLTPDQICSVLGVDAVITSNYVLTQPLSTGAAIGVGCMLSIALFNPFMILAMPTNQVNAGLALYDKETKKNIWNYNHRVAAGILSSRDALVNGLMKRSSKKTPYISK